ncbi:AAA family ATPase [Prevotella denticola]|uniref:AAA family ATPase n=1 Tax=Prevotella denticola TaxID=28129 RepID=UPI0022E1643A|nr:AAA family ATPase [Prevotella denticola]
MDELIKTIPKLPEMDYILSSFHELQEQDAIDAGGFHVSSMNDCVRKGKLLPPLVVLYPNIVLEGDLCIIFGQSGIGKTIFAMQVAKDIAAQGKRVLYADFEMTLRQLALRYEVPNFPPTFFRAEMDKDNLIDDVLKGIEKAAVANLAEVVFIDNITALSQSLDKSSDAGSLMASLNALKRKYNWTLVVLNHVPKMFSGSVPLSLSAIQGSAKLNQLIDDAVGLGQSSRDKSLVYVKQCKWRNGELILDSDNVALYERAKNKDGNLCFTFRGYDTEVAHLETTGTNGREELKAKVKELSSQGMRQQDIAKECGITQSKVSRLLNS